MKSNRNKIHSKNSGKKFNIRDSGCLYIPCSFTSPLKLTYDRIKDTCMGIDATAGFIEKKNNSFNLDFVFVFLVPTIKLDLMKDINK